MARLRQQADKLASVRCSLSLNGRAAAAALSTQIPRRRNAIKMAAPPSIVGLLEIALFDEAQYESFLTNSKSPRHESNETAVCRRGVSEPAKSIPNEPGWC